MESRTRIGMFRNPNFILIERRKERGLLSARSACVGIFVRFEWKITATTIVRVTTTRYLSAHFKSFMIFKCRC